MADGAADPLAADGSYEAALDEERQLCDEMGIVPWCLRSIVPDDLRLTTAGHHKVVTDADGNRWMSVSSFHSFKNACAALNLERALPPGAVIWVVITPQLSLQDAKNIKRLLLEGQAMFGLCSDILFQVKNIHLLNSKCEDQDHYAALEHDLMVLLDSPNDRCQMMTKHSGYKEMVTVSADCLDEHQKKCSEYKEKLLLSMYWREICDDNDYDDRFGPHKSILKLLPELHHSVYGGPGKFDPCKPLVNNDEGKMRATSDAVNEAMEDLLKRNSDFQKEKSVDHMACLLFHAEGKHKKLHELSSAFGKLNLLAKGLQQELRAATAKIHDCCIKPTLVGNLASGPEWMLEEDDYVSDFDERASKPWEVYPQRNSDE